MRARSCLAAATLLLAACGDGAGDPVSTTTAAEPTTTTGATTTTAPASTTTTTAVPASPQPTPREAVEMLLAAWRAGSRELALAVAEVEAVDALFAAPAEDADDRGCNEPPAGFGAPTYCVYRLASGAELQVRARPLDTGGFVVDQVVLSPV